MSEKENKTKEPEQNSNKNKSKTQFVGIREKLILIFLLVKIIPLILLAVIAWRALIEVGDILRKTSIKDTREALTDRSIESIERISTTTSQKAAEFLYARDADIMFLSKGLEHFDFSTDAGKAAVFFSDFCGNKTGKLRRQKQWKVSSNGMSWESVEPFIPKDNRGAERSVNKENNDTVDGATFKYRPPYGFEDSRENFINVPLYDEIALIDLNGQQIAKYITPKTAKKRFTFPKELLNVSDPQNTFIKSEHYFDELKKLDESGIYVSDVIGAYVPCHFIGMYTPDNMAAKLIQTKITELEKDSDASQNSELVWKLRVLDAELRDDKKNFNGNSPVNKKNRDEIDRRLGKNKTWNLNDKDYKQAAAELKELGLTELSEAVLDIQSKWHPEQEGYAGAENPLGIRFEGIIRWAKPVIDEKTKKIKGYVTFALNHDHLLDMIAHITPMDERYYELSNAWDGNYAFIWDYNCRSIVHPRHYSIVGYNPETGKPETPWLESTIYEGMKKADIKRENWQDYIKILEKDPKDPYIPFTGNKDSIAYQSRKKKPAPELTKEGLVGLDGRYLNNAPQCTGWIDLAKDGGSGSLYILWSGVYKLNTASAIPYYTGQYNPDTRPRLPDGSKNRIGFGFVAIGCGIDDFNEPANVMGRKLTEMVNSNLSSTTIHLVFTTLLLSILVIFIAVWMASYLSGRLTWLIEGVSKFRTGARNFRFASKRQDEFGKLADSFDNMADNIVNSVHNPLLILDNNKKVIYVNEQGLELFGKKLEEIVGKDYKDISIYPYETQYCPLTSLIKTGNNKAEVFFDPKSGRYWQGSANYFTNEYGQYIGYMVTSNDVHRLQMQQVELEQAKKQAEETSRHKSEFLSRMSHELRTPMNAIIGVNNLTQQKINSLKNKAEYIELEKNLEDMQESSKHLLMLLNDILDMSNLETNSVNLDNHTVDLYEMLDSLAGPLILNSKSKHIEYQVKFAEFKPSKFITDDLRLRQILNNLLHNAVKFTLEYGKIEFIVFRKDRENGKSLISFCIRDTGIGIAAEDLGRILNPFEQVDMSFTRKYGGSGLGLSIVQHLLKLFGSEIHIKSETGKGSEFSFNVWLQEDEKSEKFETVDITGKFKGQQALVIDDVAINRMVLVSLLKTAGFITDEAKDGAEGLVKFAKSPEKFYDVVFMDLQMPVMDGYESSRAIRALERSDAASVPIIAISANAFKEDVNKSLANGMNGHYAKPIKVDALSEILLKHCIPTMQ